MEMTKRIIRLEFMMDPMDADALDGLPDTIIIPPEAVKAIADIFEALLEGGAMHDGRALNKPAK